VRDNFYIKLPTCSFFSQAAFSPFSAATVPPPPVPAATFLASPRRREPRTVQAPPPAGGPPPGPRAGKGPPRGSAAGGLPGPMQASRPATQLRSTRARASLRPTPQLRSARARSLLRRFALLRSARAWAPLRLAPPEHDPASSPCSPTPLRSSTGAASPCSARERAPSSAAACHTPAAVGSRTIPTARNRVVVVGKERRRWPGERRTDEWGPLGSERGKELSGVDVNGMWDPLVNVFKKPQLFYRTIFSFLTTHNQKQFFLTTHSSQLLFQKTQLNQTHP
jgi:hypothetical protein